jgi:hypothetical protein
MASHASELVAEMFIELKTDNVYVHEDLLEAAARLPSPLAAKVADREAKWVEAQQWLYGLYDDKAVALIRHLLSQPEGRKAALAFARTLLRLSPGKEILTKQLKGKFDNYSYKEVVESLVQPVIASTGQEGVEFFADLLETALRLTSEQKPEDYSYIWRPAIEDHERNDLRDNDIPSVLVGAVRTAAVGLLKRDPKGAELTIQSLLSRGWRAFRRLAYFVSKDRLAKSSLLNQMLVSREALEDIGSRHEYSQFLASRFALLDAPERAQLLAWIDQGPTFLKKGEEHYEARLGKWQSSLLHLVREHLTGKDLEKYNRLVQTYGESEPPDFPFKVGAGWVGPTSPATKEELAKKSDQELFDLLLTWTPDDEMFSHSRRGLARAVEQVISEEPKRMWSLGQRLRELNPTYVSALLAGLTTALGKEMSFDWKAPLSLARWITRQPFDEGEKKDWDEGDTDWGNSRMAAVRLVAAGTRSKVNPLPMELRQDAWDAFHLVTRDPDPTPAHEEKFGGTNMGPGTLALNSNRGEAMNTVVAYALWVRKHMHPSDKWSGFDSVPEVREVLEDHLDPSKDPSIAVRSVYGEWFPWLHLMDKEWAEGHRNDIFPPQKDRELYWEVAWKTYVTHADPYNDMLVALNQEYARAVENLGQSVYITDYVADPDERVAEHIVVFLVRGKLDFTDPLVLRLFEKATPELRAHIVTFLGRSLSGEKAVPREIHERMRQVWGGRLNAASVLGADTRELKAFGVWFAAKNEDLAWGLVQLVKVLSVEPQIDLEFLVLKRLAEASSTHPDQAMEALYLMLRRPDVWRMGFEKEAIRTVLTSALKASEQARRHASAVIEQFGKNGVHDFRDLWPNSRP